MVEGPRARIAAAHATALNSGDGPGLDRASQAAEELGALVPAADASTPALRALPGSEPLTAREREVVTLATSGLANQLIAERLVVSVRTVEGHLYGEHAEEGWR